MADDLQAENAALRAEIEHLKVMAWDWQMRHDEQEAEVLRLTEGKIKMWAVKVRSAKHIPDRHIYRTKGKAKRAMGPVEDWWEVVPVAVTILAEECPTLERRASHES